MGTKLIRKICHSLQPYMYFLGVFGDWMLDTPLNKHEGCECISEFKVHL